MATKLEMKNLKGLKYFMEIEIDRSRKGIFLSQRKYVLDLLLEVGLLYCKPIDTPTVHDKKLGKCLDQVSINEERYRRLVGKLIYLSYTCTNIAYVVSIVSHQLMYALS